MKHWLKVLCLLSLGGQATAQHIANENSPPKQHAVQKKFSSDKIHYDFAFLTASDGNDSDVKVMFRVAVDDWAQSPFRYRLPQIESYEGRIKFFSYDFGKHLKLVQDSVLCPQTGYALDANLNAAPFETFMVTFHLNKKVRDTKDWIFLTVDDPVFANGEFDVVVSKKDLE